MNRSRTLSCLKLGGALLALAIFIFIAPRASFGQDPQPVLAIADAKKLPLDAEVTLEGAITVASGAFRSSFSDYGFQIQDKTSGMYITIKTDPHLMVGQRVRIAGKRAETQLKFQMVETDESRIQLLSGTAHPKPTAIETGKINESAIGKLIKISAKVTKAVVEIAPYGFRVPIDDGTGEIIAYISASTGISTKAMVPGQRIELIGVAGQFNQHFQIYPRSAADVKLIGKTSAAK